MNCFTFYSGNGIYQLVHYYGKTRSNRALDLLCKIREPHDKTFLDALSDTIKEKKVMATLDLLGQIVQTAPSWTPKIALHPVFKAILQHSVVCLFPTRYSDQQWVVQG
ncbi:hypothetical protein ANCCAN_21254 [Ancylostoma caninum]|uniref:Uncharacterized protein n=1 Tax=Ancylostoma caninum TaxID=29170 RepID=A0A368FL62_ANCCA|nr:hypothetical protein ANCCAN_21254 [Ancylostoma caninum]